MTITSPGQRMSSAAALTVSRGQEAWRVLEHQGARHLARRVVRKIYQASGAAAVDVPLLLPDVADSGQLDLAVPDMRPGRDRPLRVGWVMTPPQAGSGGHTTIFRMVRALEDAGHECVLFLYDRFAGDVNRHERALRAAWPWIRAEVRDASTGLGGVDALIATSWQSAHVVASRREPVCRRLYFVQDYEPFFYPLGAEHALAQDTYRFGFRTITVGRMIASLLAQEHGVDAAVAEFGCDRAVYHLTGADTRTGVVSYVKPDAPRRGHLLAMAALAEFHQLHPDQEIHLFGDTVPNPRFPAVRHGRLSPPELNALYNRTLSGLALSFTNVSLVPDEMLAAGCVPVVNDSPHARVGLNNPHVRWCRPTPAALAAGLSAAVVTPDARQRAGVLAASVGNAEWRPAQQTVVAVVEDEVYGSPRRQA